MKKIVLLAVAFLFSAFHLSAQYCTPIGNCVRDDIINNFQFGTISNLNSGGSNCGSFFFPGNAYTLTNFSANVTQGMSYSFSVQSSTAIGDPAQGFGIWIDFNSDGDFDDANEFVYSSPTTSKSRFTGNITIPYASTLGATRMRVRSQRNSSPTAGASCQTFTSGETEDYELIIRANPIPPIPEFTVSTTTGCTGGNIKFTDISVNNPTSWLWRFGDGSTSTLQNPSHVYTSPGTYTVTLLAMNSFGTDSVVKHQFINISSGTNLPTSCTPSGGSTTNGFGVTFLKFSGLNTTSPDAQSGYEDHTCVYDTLIHGSTYTLTFGATQAQGKQNFRAWLDLNGDGVFTKQEEIANLNNADSVSTTFKLSSASVINKFVRLRLAGVFNLTAPANAQFNSCSNLNEGQMEDYALFIKPSLVPPVAEFDVKDTISCDGTVSFIDKSSNAPTSWQWDFGDGNTSSAQTPQHTYQSSGTYNVTLTASNSFGSDNISKSNLFTVDLDKSVAPINCKPNTLQHRADYGIHQFSLDGKSINTDDGRVGYQDLSCTHQFALSLNKTYPIVVKTGAQNPEDVVIWLDKDTSGTFDVSERIVTSSGNTHNGSIFIDKSLPKNVAMRLRIISDVTGNISGPCHQPINGQVEDYAIRVLVDPDFPVADFSVDSAVTCQGSVQFTDLSSSSTQQWNWDFGDGNTSQLQNPSHTYQTPGSYDVTLITTNGSLTDTLTKFGYVNYDPNACIVYEIPATTTDSSLSCNGQLVDDGGASAHYSNNSQGVFIIKANGALYLELKFSQFDFAPGDSLHIYDGPDASTSPLIGSYSGSSLPNGGTLTTTSESATVVQQSNASDTASGFRMTWQCFTPTSFPSANFSGTPQLLCDEFVDFTDLSSGQPQTWFWEFGDGFTSRKENPSHWYSKDGVYDVKLTVTNNAGSDVIEKKAYIRRASSNCVGIEGVTAANGGVQLYPNPADNELNIAFSEAIVDEIDIHITNLMGQSLPLTVEKVSDKQIRFDVSSLPNGVYNISFKHPYNQWNEKFIKR